MVLEDAIGRDRIAIWHERAVAQKYLYRVLDDDGNLYLSAEARADLMRLFEPGDVAQLVRCMRENDVLIVGVVANYGLPDHCSVYTGWIDTMDDFDFALWVMKSDRSESLVNAAKEP